MRWLVRCSVAAFSPSVGLVFPPASCRPRVARKYLLLRRLSRGYSAAAFILLRCLATPTLGIVVDGDALCDCLS
jgi:hypothetical protein